MNKIAMAGLAAVMFGGGSAGAADLPGVGGGSYALHVTSLKEARFRASLSD